MEAAVDVESAVGSDIPPNETLYVQNINEKIKKSALKKALYALFSPYGRIVDVIAMRTNSLRGQAWVVFADVASATTALRERNGTPFHDKPLKVNFAKTKSDATAKKEGIFVAGEKRKRTAISGGDASTRAPPAKKAATASVAVPGADVSVAAGAEPNKVLLASNIPAEITEPMVRALFGKYAGLKDIRLVPERGFAFVEYENEAMALPALQGLNNFRMTATHTLAVAFAKK